MRRSSSVTASRCRGSVVRIQSSLLTSSRRQKSANRAAIRSTHACGGLPVLLGRLDHRLRVLVHAHQEMDLVSPEPAVAGDAVGADLLQRVPQVGVAVGVVDRGGEVELGHGGKVIGVAILSERRWPSFATLRMTQRGATPLRHSPAFPAAPAAPSLRLLLPVPVRLLIAVRLLHRLRDRRRSRRLPPLRRPPAPDTPPSPAPRRAARPRP